MDFNMVIKEELREIKPEPMDFPDVDIPNSCVYDVGVIQNLKTEDSTEDKIMEQIYPIQNQQSESETEETYDECYSCFMCNVSYNTQYDLDEHLRTHIDDETFHHSNIDSISEPLPQSSIKPSKYFRCNECLKICKSQLSYNEHMLTHTGEKPHHCRVCDRKFRHIANFRTHLKSHNNVRTLICSLCQKTIVGEKNYYIHYMDVHNNIRNPRPYQSSSSDSDEDFNPKVSYYKKKKLNSRKFRKDSEPFGPLFAKKAWEKKQQELENFNLDVDARRINMSSSPSVSSSATRACTSAAVLMSLLLALAVNHQVGAAAVDTTIVADTTVVTDATSTADVGSSNDSAVVAASTAGSTPDTTELTDTADNVLQPANYGLDPPKPPQPPPAQAKYEDIYSFVVHSKIKYRYAQTVVSSRVANKGNTSHEVQFYVTLPESAFVSKFLMEINEKVYEAYVKEKKEAKEEYIAAVNSGQTAAHVEQNARDSNKFTVSVNVEAESKVTFNLTYEQLLNRKLGIYENVINLQPGQVVKNLQVIVDIEESSNITTLEVPDIKTANEIETTVSKNKLAKVSRESDNKATITWSPTVKEQLTFTENGVKGQFIVQYDVDHNSTPNQVLIDDGYFVHFFAPTDLKPLRTHVIFVLDVSGSMVGQKLPQVKEAMGQILSEIHSDDFFTLILFSDFAQVWTINATQETSNRWDETGNNWKMNNNFSLETLGENRFVFPATEQNIQYAKKFIQDLTSESSTNMEDALTKAHSIAKLGETRFKDGANTPKPIIVFLTDGEPTTGITEPQELIKYVSNTNEEKYPIFSLGFGEGADIDFLKKLSLNNTGFARVIYEASDASLQLRNFYKEISSPILSNVTFQYIDAQVDNITVTKKSFNLLFKGTELVVAGKLKDGTSPDFNGTLNADSTEGNFNRPVVVTCFDFPIIPPTSLPTQRRIGHLEKLWAYLNIQQLMDQYELNKNENSTAKAKALELALEYSFVTPLTSLVVVKPNDTTTSAAPEKIKPLNDRYNFGSLMASSPLYQLGPSSSVMMANSFSQSSGYPASVSLKASPSQVYSLVPEDVASSASEMVPLSTISSTIVADSDNSPPTSVVDSSHVLIYTSNSTSLHDIKELTWLSDSITLNATNTVYQVSLNTTGQSYQNCTTPDQSHGNCKHLKDCVVPSILNSFDTYLSLFCPIESLYAGICCLV